MILPIGMTTEFEKTFSFNLNYVNTQKCNVGVTLVFIDLFI